MTPRAKDLALAYGLSIAIALVWSVTAHARPHHRHHHKAHHARMVIDANGNVAQIIGGRPSGCPHAYCGCGLARFLGLSDKRLWLAWNWAKLFPHTQARPGAAAVRHHHVMLLERQISGTRWLVRDFNGGRHLSWLHVRDVRGYAFVDPSSAAMAGIGGTAQ